jgi:RNA recognition motif-containing protein
MEIWKDIEGYEGYYQVSNLGQIKSLTREVKRLDSKKGFYKSKVLKLAKDQKGYLRVVLTKESKRKTFKVHRIVCNHFLFDSIEGKEINHLDGDKTNNAWYNLEVCSSSQNAIHAIKTGLRKLVKLNELKVLEIRSSSLSDFDLADKFNVTVSNIRHIKNFKSWKTV